MQQSGQIRFVHQDPITKSQRVTDYNGNVISTVDMDPWGGETSRSNNQSLMSRRYTSYERDVNGGDDAQMRRYQSRWTRFSQPDPWDGSYDMSDPQSFNRYSYVQNDPVNFVDPSGLNMQAPYVPSEADLVKGNLGRFMSAGIHTYTYYTQTGSFAHLFKRNE